MLACESITTAPEDVAKLDAESPVVIVSAGIVCETISFIFVPSEKKNLVPLSAAAKVIPVPEAVLNCTVNEPDVPFTTTNNFSKESGTVTI